MNTNDTQTNDSQARILNDLILINNDRVVGYQKAIEQLKDENADLKVLFQEKVNQSTRLKSELTKKVLKTGNKVETGTTNSGKIYRVWMDVKAFFGGADRKAILENCEVGESAALLAYKRALSSDKLSEEAYTLITSHNAELKIAHDKIKSLREAQNLTE